MGTKQSKPAISNKPVISNAKADQLYNKGTAFLTAKNYSSALECFSEIHRGRPGEKRGHSGAAWCHYHLKQYPQALNSFNTAIQFDNSNPLSFSGRGWTLFFMKDYTNAISDFQLANRLKFDDASCRGIGWSYYFLNDYQRAFTSFNEAVRLNALSTDAFDGRGWCHYKLGDYARALGDFNSSLQIKKNNKAAFNGRGWVYEIVNDFTRGLADFNEAIRIDPNFYFPYNGRGYIYYRSGEFLKAIEDYNTAIRLEPTASNVYRNLGLAQLKQGQQQLALNNIEKAIKLKKDYAYAYTARAEYYATCAGLAKNTSERQAYYQRAEADYRTALGPSLVLSVKEKEITEAGLQTVLEALKTLSSSASTSSAGRTTPSTSGLGVFSIISYDKLKFTGEELGEGSFGKVLKAQWQYVDVAVKQLKARSLTEASLAEFRTEAECHSALQHPNIVRLYGVCLDLGKYCMVMELMLKGSLFNVLHDGKDLPWTIRLSIANDIAIGLAYLHQTNIIHRDLKSLNVLLDNNMRAKLADFGLSKLKSETNSFSSASGTSAAGSLLWMAPELFQKGGQCTNASDIYALGMIFWELSSRKLPFADAAHPSLIPGLIMSGQHDDIPAETPAKLGSLIAACWSSRADKRPAAEKVVEELNGETKPATDSNYAYFSRR